MNDGSVVIIVPEEKEDEQNIEEEQSTVHEELETVEDVDSCDELVETLLRQAEENLESKESSEQEIINSRIRYDPLSIFLIAALTLDHYRNHTLKSRKTGITNS